MQANWIAIQADGYKDGAYCGSTGFSKNSAPTNSWAVSGDECSYEQGASYLTEADAKWWDDIGGTWQYTPVVSAQVGGPEN
jgi:hypothetical protein